MKRFIFPRLNGGFFSLTGKKIAVVLIGITVFISSCEDEGLIGLDMVDGTANVHAIDTLAMYAYTQLEDSVPTGNVNRVALGLINDPVFGKSRSSFYTEVRLSDNNISLGENPVLDSVVLKLKYDGYYGDTLTRQTISVYELIEKLPEDSIIYSNQTLEYDPNPLAVQQFMPSPNDSIMVDSIIRSPHLRIKLSQEFGERLVAQNDTETFDNNASFIDFLNGLYITIEGHDEAGSISFFNVAHSLTTLTLYYKNDDENEEKVIEESLIEQFPINAFCKRYNRFENFDYEGAIPYVQQQAIQGDTLLGDSLLFLQGLHGLRVKFSIPDLKEFSDNRGTISINKATLIIPVEESFVGKFYPPPSRLLIFGLDENEEFLQMTDSQLGGAIYGGDYDEAKARYEFNITRHIQQIVTGEFPTENFIIRTTNPMENANRAVIRGPGRANNNLRIEIIYSTFN